MAPKRLSYLGHFSEGRKRGPKGTAQFLKYGPKGSRNKKPEDPSAKAQRSQTKWIVKELTTDCDIDFYLADSAELRDGVNPDISDRCKTME